MTFFNREELFSLYNSKNTETIGLILKLDLLERNLFYFSYFNCYIYFILLHFLF